MSKPPKSDIRKLIWYEASSMHPGLQTSQERDLTVQGPTDVHFTLIRLCIRNC